MLPKRAASQSKPKVSPESERKAFDENSADETSSTSEDVDVRSFLRRSASLCSLHERFLHRRDVLIRESRHNPYIGYFLRHDRPGSFTLPSKSKELRVRRGSARYLPPLPAIKTSSLVSSCATTASPSPSGIPTRKTKGVTFSNTVRRSSLVMTDWGNERIRPDSRPSPSFFGLIVNSTTSVAHGVVL